MDVIVDAGVPLEELPSEARMRQAAAAAAAAAGVSRRLTLCLRVASDEVVRELNRQWRDVDAVTDVLSFPMQEGPGLDFDETLGDVVLAWPFVKREAARLGLDARAHALHLIVHAVLHLLGHDHAEPGETARMRGMERRAMRELGLHDPWPDDRREGGGRA